MALCIDHSLNLAFVGFLAPFEQAFCMQKMLRHVTSWASRRRLSCSATELAAWGDESAQEALLDPDEARDRWVVLHDALQSMGEDAKVVEKRRKKDGVAKEAQARCAR